MKWIWLVLSTSSAWMHDGSLWPSSSFRFCVEPEGWDVPDVDLHEEVRAAVEAWNTAAAGVGSFTLLDSCPAQDPGVVHVGVDSVNLSSDVRAARLGGMSTHPVAHDTCTYLQKEGEVRLVVNPTPSLWVPLAEAEGGGCGTGQVLRVVVAHEIGHLVGLAHPTGAGRCAAAEADALMSGTNPCRVDAAPAADDIAGYLALYGTPSCDPDGSCASAGSTSVALSVDTASPAPEKPEGCGCVSSGGRPGWPGFLVRRRRS